MRSDDHHYQRWLSASCPSLLEMLGVRSDDYHWTSLLPKKGCIVMVIILVIAAGDGRDA